MDEPQLPMKRIVLDEIEIVGDRANPNTAEAALALLVNGRVDLTPLLTHRFPLAEFATALDTFESRKDGAKDGREGRDQALAALALPGASAVDVREGLPRLGPREPLDRQDQAVAELAAREGSGRAPGGNLAAAAFRQQTVEARLAEVLQDRCFGGVEQPVPLGAIQHRGHARRIDDHGASGVEVLALLAFDADAIEVAGLVHLAAVADPAAHCRPEVFESRSARRT